jgi:hypothetical protein
MDNNIFETAPDIKISVKQVFNIDTDMTVEGFSKKNQFVPELDSAYKFDRDTTLAILAGFVFNKKSFNSKAFMAQENQHTLNKLQQD